MKTVFIGDLHGRDIWKEIVWKEEADRYIFIGDYFDSFDVPALLQMHNFKELMEWSNHPQAEFVYLVGNHDYHYFEGVSDTNTSGYQFKMAPALKMLLRDYKDRLQMAYRFDNVLCTHAGVSTDFMDSVFGKDGWSEDNIVELLNEQWKYKPLTFGFAEMCNTERLINPYGDNVQQSPLWIRSKSLMNSNYHTLRKKFIQVVGHTPQRKIDIKGMATGGRYYFIDTFNVGSEYLVYEDGKFSVNNLEKE